MKTRIGMMVLAMVGCMLLSGSSSQADLAIQSFDSSGQLTFSTLNNGTNYNYQVEWAPSPAGPWSSYSGAGSWLEISQAAQGSNITNTVPMCYRVVATLGDYMVVDISGGTNATTYPVSYYRTLADIPGGVGVNADAYKTTNMVFRRIPAGTFTMGTPAGELGRDSDEVEHQVTLKKSFYIGVFKVTQKQWERVMGTWPSFFTNVSCRDSRPVEQVTYEMIRGSNVGAGWPSNSNVDTDSFMGCLRTRTGKTFDLPTEAQWEYAGRAGTHTALNSGKNLTSGISCPNMAEVGRYSYNGGSPYTQGGDTSVGPAKVGSYLPNAWGLYDMHGNAWEICLDWYGAYPGTVNDPKGASTGVGRVMRGGSWGSSHAYDCRMGNRYDYRTGPPGDGNNGFRIVLQAAQ